MSQSKFFNFEANFNQVLEDKKKLEKFENQIFEKVKSFKENNESLILKKEEIDQIIIPYLKEIKNSFKILNFLIDIECFLDREGFLMCLETISVPKNNFEKYKELYSIIVECIIKLENTIKLKFSDKEKMIIASEMLKKISKNFKYEDFIYYSKESFNDELIIILIETGTVDNKSNFDKCLNKINASCDAAIIAGMKTGIVNKSNFDELLKMVPKNDKASVIKAGIKKGFIDKDNLDKYLKILPKFSIHEIMGFAFDLKIINKYNLHDKYKEYPIETIITGIRKKIITNENDLFIYCKIIDFDKCLKTINEIGRCSIIKGLIEEGTINKDKANRIVILRKYLKNLETLIYRSHILQVAIKAGFFYNKNELDRHLTSLIQENLISIDNNIIEAGIDKGFIDKNDFLNKYLSKALEEYNFSMIMLGIDKGFIDKNDFLNKYLPKAPEKYNFSMIMLGIDKGFIDQDSLDKYLKMVPENHKASFIKAGIKKGFIDENNIYKFLDMIPENHKASFIKAGIKKGFIDENNIYKFLDMIPEEYKASVIEAGIDKGFIDKDNIYDFLKSFSNNNVNHFGKIITSICRNYHTFTKSDEIIFDSELIKFDYFYKEMSNVKLDYYKKIHKDYYKKDYSTSMTNDAYKKIHKNYYKIKKKEKKEKNLIEKFSESINFDPTSDILKSFYEEQKNINARLNYLNESLKKNKNIKDIDLLKEENDIRQINSKREILLKEINSLKEKSSEKIKNQSIESKEKKEIEKKIKIFNKVINFLEKEFYLYKIILIKNYLKNPYNNSEVKISNQENTNSTLMIGQ